MPEQPPMHSAASEMPNNDQRNARDTDADEEKKQSGETTAETVAPKKDATHTYEGDERAPKLLLQTPKFGEAHLASEARGTAQSKEEEQAVEAYATEQRTRSIEAATEKLAILKETHFVFLRYMNMGEYREMMCEEGGVAEKERDYSIHFPKNFFEWVQYGGATAVSRDTRMNWAEGSNWMHQHLINTLKYARKEEGGIAQMGVDLKKILFDERTESTLYQKVEALKEAYKRGGGRFVGGIGPEGKYTEALLHVERLSEVVNRVLQNEEQHIPAVTEELRSSLPADVFQEIERKLAFVEKGEHSLGDSGIKGGLWNSEYLARDIIQFIEGGKPLQRDEQQRQPATRHKEHSVTQQQSHAIERWCRFAVEMHYCGHDNLQVLKDFRDGAIDFEDRDARRRIFDAMEKSAHRGVISRTYDVAVVVSGAQYAPSSRDHLRYSRQQWISAHKGKPLAVITQRQQKSLWKEIEVLNASAGESAHVLLDTKGRVLWPHAPDAVE
jgi:hypothetical protein